MGRQFSIRETSWIKDEQAIKQVRIEVFVQGQATPIAEEFDTQDCTAIHWLAIDLDGKPIGTGRLLDTGQIGRMAVVEAFRGQQVGAAILDAAMVKAQSLALPTLFLNAQTHALKFYEKAGFEACGDIFDEVGIDHQRMELHRQ